jgi:hypothetical protein
MSQDPPKGPDTEVESTVDRFEHEIEELEQPLGLSARQWIVGVAVMAGIVGAFLLGSYLQAKKADASRPAILVIETISPRSGLLYEKPTRFQWDSISRTSQYVLSIREYQGDRDLIIRETPTSTIELTEDEVGRLAKGGRYQWKVLARSSDGWTIGEGNSSFSL